MNLIVDSGAELGVGWTASGGADRWDYGLQQPFAGDWSFYIPGERVGGVETRGTITWALATEAGKTVTVSLYIFDRPLAANQSVIVQADLGAGFIDLLRITEGDYTPDANGWAYVPVGTFVPLGSSTPFRIFTETHVSDGSGHCFIDNVAAESDVATLEDAVAIGKNIANAALIEALAGIDGVGYYTNLEGRVYDRLLTPGDTEAELPFCSVALVGEDEVIEFRGVGAVSRWTMRVHFFCKDNRDSDAFNTATRQACGEFRDDIVKMVMTDQYLSATVKNVEVKAVRSFAGGDDLGYGEVVIEIELMQIFGANDLGPTA